MLAYVAIDVRVIKKESDRYIASDVLTLLSSLLSIEGFWQ